MATVTPLNSPPANVPKPADRTDTPGFNVLLEGDAGTGKTYAIGSLVETGLDVFYLAMQPSEIEALLGYFDDRKKDVPPNLHWHLLKPPAANLNQMIENATAINQYTYEMLTKMSDPQRNLHNQFITLLKTLNNFVDQRTGETFGPVNSWGANKALVIDPMTVINRAAMSLVVGGKPVRAQNEWGVAQDQVEKLVGMLTSDCNCHFVLIAHVEKELDPIQGGMRITVSTLGKALAPKLPPMFSDILYSYRELDKFYWSTANSTVVLKTRNLPIADKITPDFGTIFRKWQERRARIVP